jgi:hypothetical protein
MGEMRNAYKIFVGDHSEDLVVDGKVILEWILGKSVGRCGMDASGSG